MLTPKDPLVGKEQARKYAKSQNCRFIILSNGNLHYFWDLERGNPYVITAFPSPASVTGYQKSAPDPKRLIEEVVGDDYVALIHWFGYRLETRRVDRITDFFPELKQTKAAFIGGRKLFKDELDRIAALLNDGTKEGQYRFKENARLVLICGDYD